MKGVIFSHLTQFNTHNIITINTISAVAAVNSIDQNMFGIILD